MSADAYAECGVCRHYPAQHDGQRGRPCRAWVPDNDDSYCACPGWQEPKTAAPVEAKPWGWERKDLQGDA